MAFLFHLPGLFTEVLEYGVSISSQPGLFTEVLEYGVSISSLPGLFVYPILPVSLDCPFLIAPFGIL
jgi:hypothetical protein